ncbi:bifunctional diaminohydroxyphosphoribosylaminopyrimidine deaminase/5-amino-6-(5-phosphoribosylamino)uracil reductase RibD [Mycetocola spongiae]|uniref:bifunctional diaminohydroxyphosphoribosylaminopyrimidine deaminase/5-amino-6-(5-phosphoribosylamino)uracil reductase RibD n=1 Tax=Mycetocola spongiae TaxID=2859226 RepID=UPI001CF0EC52|nr:bifunctional diaminohydroxyphosphoribosylaminopyrimidine deaminase/5-amino-6-(5-phosphoribosylamino)uracil reductase RibD [Mycetocola spongiae]
MISDTQLEPAMRRAFELAARGPERGVNPRVGCVILSPGGEVLAEGWHRGSGTAHAEVDALGRLADPGLARGATAVVTLEPCNHTGRTGPCARALIAAGIAHVVYAVSDPGAARVVPDPVTGELAASSAHGAQTLRDAGVSVRAGLLRAEGEALLGDWLASARLGRPVVTVKWASSLDGRGAAADGSSQWITGPEARADVHAWRSRAEAIAVGTGTVLADDPALTARIEGVLAEDQPIPVVFGRRAIPADAQLKSHPHTPIQVSGADLEADLRELYALGIHSVFVEGGPALASSFLAAGLADTVLVYLAPTLIGGPRVAVTDLGITSITQQQYLVFDDVQRLGSDLRIVAHTTGEK